MLKDKGTRIPFQMSLQRQGSCWLLVPIFFQIVARSPHTLTKYLNDKKTHAANNVKLFKKINLVNNALYEVELAKAEIEHKEPILVEFFIPHYAKPQMLEFYYNFSTKFVIKTSSKIWRWTQVLCILLLPRKKGKIATDQKWQQSGSACHRRILSIVLLLMQSQTSSPCRCCDMHRKHDKREPGFFKVEFRFKVMFYVHVAKPLAVLMLAQTNINLLVKVWSKVYSIRTMTDFWNNTATS